MKKIIILIISIVLVVVTIISYNIYVYSNNNKKAMEKNKIYEQFYNVEVLGTDIASLINKVDDSNNKNNVEKDEKGLFINNNNNSISIEVNFLELDEPISSEKIEEQGITRFIQNFGAVEFKCTKIEYHKQTKYVKYMYFEQV